MKIDNIKGEKAFDVVAELAECVEALRLDNKAVDIFGMKECPEGITSEAFIKQRVRKAIALLAKDHKETLVKICALVNDVMPEEYVTEATPSKIATDIIYLVTDEVFNIFFT